MAIDFPNSPQIGAVVTVDNKTFRWTGTLWNLDSSLGVVGPTGPTGPAGVQGPTGSVTLNATSPLVWTPLTSTLSAPQVQTAAEAAASTAAAITAHNAQGTNVHGIFDVEELETQEGALEKAQLWSSTYVETHRADTTNVHGIANTDDIVQRTIVDVKGDLIVGTANNDIARVGTVIDGSHLEADATVAAGLKWSTRMIDHESDTTNVHGILNSAALLYSDSTVITNAAGAAVSPYTMNAPSVTALLGALHCSATAIDTAPRTTNSTTSLASAVTFFTFFTPLYTKTISSITMVSGSVVSANLTYGRYGLYIVDSADVATLVARTAIDTTILSGISQLYTRSLVADSTYPSQYTLQAGQRYAVAIMTIGTSPGSVYMNYTSSPTMINSLPPRMTGAAGSQTDLPTTRSTYSNTVSSPWARLS